MINRQVISIIGRKEVNAALVQINEKAQISMAATMETYKPNDLNLDIYLRISLLFKILFYFLL
jgi:hypothetical protein